MRRALRVGLLSLLTTLTLTTFLGEGGDGALAARNLFDDKFADCPASVRVASLTGVQAVRTTKDDELKVEWDAAPWASWNLHGATAEITVQVQSKDRTKTLQTAHKALGATSTTFTKVDLATDWVIQVAVTDRQKVISDIVEVEFTSGVKKPVFFSGLYWAGPITGGHTTAKPSSGTDTSVDKAADKVGDFYYLGFNKYFDNWYVEGALEHYNRNDNAETIPSDLDLTAPISQIPEDRQPNTAKFRVGLRHGVANPGDADFDHFRIRVEDESGDNVLGFDAETVTDGFYAHGTKEFALRGRRSWKDHPNVPPGPIANVALSNRVTDDGQRVDAIYTLHAVPALMEGTTAFHLYGIGHTPFDPAAAAARAPTTANTSALCQTALATALGNQIRLAADAEDMSYAQLKTFGTTEAQRDRYLYAELPDQVYDLPKDIFRRDGTYTLWAWAEDNKDNPISPRTEIAFSIQERVDEPGVLKSSRALGPNPENTTAVLNWLVSTSNWATFREIVDPYKPIDGVRFANGKCELGTEAPLAQTGDYLPYLIPDPNRLGDALVVGLTIVKQ